MCVLNSRALQKYVKHLIWIKINYWVSQSLFGFFHKMEQKTQMSFLANPIYIYSGVLLGHEKRMKSCHLQQCGRTWEYYAKWNESERNSTWFHLHVESKKKTKQMKKQNRNKFIGTENKLLMVAKGERGQGDRQNRWRGFRGTNF